MGWKHRLNRGDGPPVAAGRPPTLLGAQLLPGGQPRRGDALYGPRTPLPCDLSVRLAHMDAACTVNIGRRGVAHALFASGTVCVILHMRESRIHRSVGGIHGCSTAEGARCDL